MYHCELCDRWFCKRHLKPRLAFIRNFDAIESSREIRVLYETEVKGKEGLGHPDFQYSLRRFRELDIEEKRRNELIKQALDRMNHYYADVEIPEKPIDLEQERKRTVETLLKEEEEIEKKQQLEKQKQAKERATGQTETIGNKYGKRFVVPLEVYRNETYREYLDYAQTEKSVKDIVDEYYKKYGRREKSEETNKKKHWWP